MERETGRERMRASHIAKGEGKRDGEREMGRERMRDSHIAKGEGKRDGERHGET